MGSQFEICYWLPCCLMRLKRKRARDGREKLKKKSHIEDSGHILPIHLRVGSRKHVSGNSKLSALQQFFFGSSRARDK